ncbi:DNA polymerase III, tau subunit [Thermus arciformis]|uniref:DNA polymerase III subunit gamma/tau n=1 Tax=Thermus arciformis TaxID=482827 RepID=A0A1G7DAK8_9DEIN|nr:DNA polymerase III subunit gamma/tau [Thermus arciformis]SDE47946.1 DNA polymerase III, tau subunit [Thermus arciformis]
MGALYRRFRPLTFQEVVGQEHVKEPLQRAIREGRLAQAYLFSGPRGVGKTTTARLLAMAVGCEAEERPCGVCAHCQAVQKGAHPDVVEIDAASNNSVEDVRELKERILLAPLSAPRKVFILDEAHMLSKSAFNALLKTLEEPPPHVLFVFATTEPERMPPTILSRTQHFRFRRLREEEIAAKLRRILEEVEGEGREAEEEALLLVARLADGAMRDAESLLDRLLLLEGPLTRAKVEEALGLPPKEALSRLARALAEGRVGEALGEARRLYGQGFAPRSLVLGLMEVLREGLYAAYGLGGASLPASPLALLQALTALDEASERLAKRSDLLGLEAALLQAFPPSSPPRPQEAPPDPLVPAPPPEPKEEAPADPAGRWRAFLEALKPTLRAFVREARPELQGKTLLLRFPENKAFHHKKAEEQKGVLLPLAKAHFGVEDLAFLLEKKTLEVSAGKPPEAPRAREGQGGAPNPPPSSPDGIPPDPSEAPPPPTEDPKAALARLSRLLGGRLLWVRGPKEASEPGEPLSEENIGGTGI